MLYNLNSIFCFLWYKTKKKKLKRRKTGKLCLGYCQHKDKWMDIQSDEGFGEEKKEFILLNLLLKIFSL